MTAVTQIGQLLEDLTDAELDAVRNLVNAARADREHVRKRQVAVTLAPGVRVRLTGNLRPMYLRGQLGTVNGYPAGDRIAVTPDNPATMPRFVDRTTGDIRVPLGCVEVIA